MTNDIAVYQQTALTVGQVKDQVQLIQHIMKEVMHKDTHFGAIPGCGDKPTLLKAGAEKLAVTFRFATDISVERIEMGSGHREYEVTVRVLNSNGDFLGAGVGACSTMEGKYRYRNAGRVCPECKAENTIIKGKEEYGGGWICFARKGGCGEKWKDGDKAIEGQQPGKVEHDNPADYYNTCLKMAKKRAMVDAILTTTAASDIFTQDIEDDPERYGGKAEKQPQKVQHENHPKQQNYPQKEQQNLYGEDENGFISDGQIKTLRVKIKETDLSEDDVCIFFSIGSLDQIPANKATEAIVAVSNGVIKSQQF